MSRGSPQKECGLSRGARGRRGQGQAPGVQHSQWRELAHFLSHRQGFIPSLRLMTTPRRLWLPRSLHAVSAHTAARRRAKLGKAGRGVGCVCSSPDARPSKGRVLVRSVPGPSPLPPSRCILPSRHLKQKTELGGVWTTRALIGCQLFRVSQRDPAPRRLRWPILHSVWVES